MPTTRSHRHRLIAPALAFCATLLALPTAAVTIPDVPLQSGSAYPAPNVMFILDDSGSMEFDFMPGVDRESELPAVSPINIAPEAWTRNTLHYNPSVQYQAWIKADDTRYTDGTSYTSAFDHDSLLQDTINLAQRTRTFYVPKDGATNMAATGSYWRFQVPVGGGSMIRSEYGAVTSGGRQNAANFPARDIDNTTSGSTTSARAIVVPANVTTLIVSTSGGRHGTNGGNNNDNGNGADLYLRFGSDPTTTTYDCRSTNDANTESCTIDHPAEGTWYVVLHAASPFRNVDLAAALDTQPNRCGGGNDANDWINCVAARPQYKDATGATVTRSLSDELTNYATWYSYHRTRMKVAKAGASEAFSRLNRNMRVGYDSIWNRNPYRIPVGNNNGLFDGTNRSEWFSHLHAANGNGGTPLHGALRRTGEYFTDTAADGPWGPQTGDSQISCRQNFAILTTDGYWNDDTGYRSNLVGDADGTAGPTITGPGGKSYTYTPESPYSDNFTGNPRSQANTLADVAMHYWKRDLVDALENNVPTSSDPAFWQHMVTFGVSIGLQGRRNPATDLPLITNGSEHWGDPMNAVDADRIDDLWHAAVNGRGNFVAARNPLEFAQSLAEALKTVEARLGSASNVTANTTSFTGDSRVYQAKYVSGKWTGELAAYDASEAGVADVEAWNASERIAYAGRKVFTWTGTAGATFPTAAQVTALDRSTGVAPVTGANNAEYIKGDWSRERRMTNGTLRNRDVLLGDIANSSPAYAADSRTLFVGANDGMLHAFDATNGNELFAYVPGGVDLSWLKTLSDPQYAHKYFVDGPIVVSTTKQTPGRNVLVGALGRGGKGLYALDVTTPAEFEAADAMWELRDHGGDMGLVLGDPLVVTLNDAAATKAVIFGNGINSTNGHSVLFVVDLLTGVVLKKIDTGAAGDNGLSEPRGRDVDGNGTVDVVYAGDLAGNLWKFDLSGNASSTWTVALGGQPLYRTRTGQPISAGVAVARNPLDNKPWVFFGTGRYLSSLDVADTSLQTLYGIVDEGTQVTESELQARDIALVADYQDEDDVRAFEKSAPLPAGKRGWFLDLDAPRSGERIVVRPQVRGIALITSSMIPPTPTACDADGAGYLNAIDAFTGTALSEPYFDVDGDGRFDDDDKIGSGDGRTGVGSIDTGVGNPTKGTFIGNLVTLTGSNGTLADRKTNGQGGLPHRVMWREILQD